MHTVGFLILFPLLSAVLLALIGHDGIRKAIVRVSALVIAAASIYLAYRHLGGPLALFVVPSSHLLDKLLFAGDIAVAVFLLWRCKDMVKKEAWIPVLIVIQLAMMAWAEFGGQVPPVESPLYVDSFSSIMALIIGIVGTLICVYALAYMRDYHGHHGDVADHRKSFFFTMFFFLSGMFGVVFANNLAWMFFFWEITTLCSFILIGYSRTSESVRNSFLALGLNTVGSLGFAAAILYQARFSSAEHTLDLNRLIQLGPTVALLPALLISFAGMAKAAQLPFSAWLLGAMVAPTPVSALLHSSTMVKAGVFAIVKFAPVFRGTYAGLGVALIGGFTFLMASLMAVTQSNAKRVLAYSTIANLGLVVACAGVGTVEAVWAAILLIIFHAVAKGLLFLSVGTVEHRIGSRDIEDMDGLIVTRPALALVIVIGICGMFLAPFGMLISKWTCLKAFVDASPLLAVLLAYGSAPTLFFWSKWLGKIVSVPSGATGTPGGVSGDEWTALGLLAAGTAVTTAAYPLISTRAIDPYLREVYMQSLVMSRTDVAIMLVMLGLLVLIPVAFLFYPKRSTLAPSYLAGANIGGSGAFANFLGQPQEVGLRNYYLSGFLGEKGLMKAGVIIAILLVVVAFVGLAI